MSTLCTACTFEFQTSGTLAELRAGPHSQIVPTTSGQVPTSLVNQRYTRPKSFRENIQDGPELSLMVPGTLGIITVIKRSVLYNVG